MTEETFVRELGRRADDVHGAPLSLEDVRGKAHAIRRRRRTTAAAAVAAAVAVVVLVPTVLSGGHTKRSEAPEPAPSPPAHAAVLHDGQLTLPSGGTVELGVDTADVTDLGVLTDGRIVVALQKPYAVRVYAPDGTLSEQYAVQSNAITTSPDDTLAAWVDENFRISVIESGVAAPTTLQGIPMPGESAGSIDAILGTNCAQGGCKALVGDWNTTTGESTVTSHANLATSEPLRVTDVSPDGSLWAVKLPRPDADPQFGCSGLYDPASHRVVAENCDTSLLRFAPDGEHLMGMRGDNAMFPSVEVFDTDLRLVRSWSPGKGAVVKDAVWDDASHLLVVTAGLGDRPEWSLLRVPIDGGDPEVVAGPEPGPNAEQSATFFLAE